MRLDRLNKGMPVENDSTPDWLALGAIALVALALASCGKAPVGPNAYIPVARVDTPATSDSAVPSSSDDSSLVSTPPPPPVIYTSYKGTGSTAE